MNSKAILFDLGDTLVTRSVKDFFLIRDALKKIDKLFKLETNQSSEKYLLTAYKEVYAEIDQIREKVYVEIPLNAWLSKLLIRVYGDKFSEKILKDAIKIVIDARTSFIEIFDGVPEVLNELKRSYKIGMISNNSSNDVVFRVLSKLNILNFFDVIVTSAEFGIRKPYPGIFLYALEKLNIECPKFTVFVGDSIKHDIYGAKNAGMNAILLNQINSSKKTYPADFRIKEIKELPVAIESTFE